jgi:hypothetical protein
MNAFVKGVQSLFSGPDTSAQEKQIAQAKEEQSIALARQQQNAQQEQARADLQAGLASRMPRGRRLLQAATGDQGVTSTLGG